jgi:CheY-like chemotaxis protein
MADRLRVLCVDDNRDVADSNGELFELTGCEVRVCYSGAEALAATGEFRPDVCVLDLNMPGMDGEHLAVWLRARCDGQPTVFVALTGLCGEDAHRRSRAAGFDLHLTKPVDPQHLLAAVRDLSRWAKEQANSRVAR